MSKYLISCHEIPYVMEDGYERTNGRSFRIHAGFFYTAQFLKALFLNV
jgi:hypothetical protein